MSDPTAPVINLAPAEETPETKQSFFQKAKTYARNHKKPIIAMGLLGAVVAGSAVTGRKTATVTVQSPLEIEIEDEQTEDQSA